MDDNAAKHTHLQMIQGVINRLSNNSFLLKGWAVVLVSGLFAFAAKDAKAHFIYIAYFPCVVFWGLDGYFLLLERRFRTLYREVSKCDTRAIDYSMDASKFHESWLKAVFSKTLLSFHGVIVLTIITVTLVTLCS
jgi:hypothetical protein